MRIVTNTLFTTDLTPLFPLEKVFRRIDLDFGLVKVEFLLPSRGGGREEEVW